jgi:hypothetical protein
MRDHELSLILKWIGWIPGTPVTEQMLLSAIQYAYDMGLTDGRQ